jgi:hypothetical protein
MGMKTLLLFAVLVRLVPLAAALFQLVGTGLIVWGLKVTKDKPGVRRLLLESSATPLPTAAIVREHPWAVNVGLGLLLGGLVLQVVAALL